MSNRNPLQGPHRSLTSPDRVKQRQRWPQELRVAISAADADGIRPSVIRRMVKSGELDGIDRGFDVPAATFWDILRRERENRQAATQPVEPGDEEKAANAILRRAIEIAQREITKLEVALTDRRKTEAEQTQLTRRLEILIRMVRSYETKGRGEKGRSKTPTEKAGQASAKAASNPLSDMIRSKERELAKS